MSNIIEMSTQDREDEIQERYREFRGYYDNTTLSVTQILREMGLTSSCSLTRGIRKQLRVDGCDPYKRSWRIRRENKK
jgi:hypothetical protein